MVQYHGVPPMHAAVLLVRGAVKAGVLLALAVGAPLPAELDAFPQGSGVPTPQAVPAQAPDLFAGTWDYNSNESVDAGTGRREQAPRSATQRGVGAGTRGGDPA